MRKRTLGLKIHAAFLAVSCVAFLTTGQHLKAVDEQVTSTNTTGAKPDNSAVNERDRHNANPTPEDQSNNKSDLEITKKIRRALVNKTNDLSTAGKNIKVITVNGKVTLRGPVNSEEEKAKIDRLAKEAAGDANVTDELEVKNSK